MTPTICHDQTHGHCPQRRFGSGSRLTAQVAWVCAVALAGVLPAQASERVRLAGLGGLAVDTTEVTVAQFARYVRATGIVTQAERDGGEADLDRGWREKEGGLHGRASSSSRVSRAIMRSSSVGTTSTGSGESSVVMRPADWRPWEALRSGSRRGERMAR